MLMMLLGIVMAAPVAPVHAPQAPHPAAVRARAPSRAQVLAAVRAEWPHYDPKNSGRLTPLQFSTWVIRAHGGTVAARPHGEGIAPVSAMNAASTAFARADANHDGAVTPDEMADFLMAPAALRSVRTVGSAHAAPAPAHAAESAGR